MTYEIADIQNITVTTITGEQTSLLVIKVNYQEDAFKYTKIFELDPSITDQEISDLVVTEGQQIKQEPKREINISGVI